MRGLNRKYRPRLRLDRFLVKFCEERLPSGGEIHSFPSHNKNANLFSVIIYNTGPLESAPVGQAPACRSLLALSINSRTDLLALRPWRSRQSREGRFCNNFPYSTGRCLSVLQLLFLQMRKLRRRFPRPRPSSHCNSPVFHPKRHHKNDWVAHLRRAASADSYSGWRKPSNYVV
jgi:hypothetical protein